jgi:hypothetical protein
MQALIFAGLGQLVEGGIGGGHRDAIGAVGAGHGDGAVGHQRHDILAPAQCCHWEAAAHSLGEGREIRGDAVMALGPAEGDAEAGDHLVEDQ